MPTTFRSVVTASVGTAATTVYTVPAGAQSVVTALNVANRLTNQQVLATINLIVGGTTVTLVRDVALPIGSSLAASGGPQRLALQAGSQIQVVCNVAAGLDVTTSVTEIT